MILNDSTVIIRNNEIEVAEMDGEIGMLNIETGKYYMLNGIGTDIWSVLKTEKTFEQLVDELLKLYIIDRETCSTETSEFVNEMIANKLITLL